MSLSAVQKEAAWLAAYNPADGLPALLKANLGPLQTVQGYWKRQINTNAPALYLMHRGFTEERSANLRTIRTHRFVARIEWPNTQATLEAAQLALDNAVDLVLLRIRAFPLDHTHGGAFLSVAEGVSPVDNSGLIEVEFADPEQALASKHPLRCDITYHADDFEVTT